MGEVDHVFPSTKNMKQSSDMEKRKPKGKCQKIELYREPQTNGAKGIKTFVYLNWLNSTERHLWFGWT